MSESECPFRTANNTLKPETPRLHQALLPVLVVLLLPLSRIDLGHVRLEHLSDVGDDAVRALVAERAVQRFQIVDVQQKEREVRGLDAAAAPDISDELVERRLARQCRHNVERQPRLLLQRAADQLGLDRVQLELALQVAQVRHCARKTKHRFACVAQRQAAVVVRAAAARNLCQWLGELVL